MNDSIENSHTPENSETWRQVDTYEKMGIRESDEKFFTPISLKYVKYLCKRLDLDENENGEVRISNEEDRQLLEEGASDEMFSHYYLSQSVSNLSHKAKGHLDTPIPYSLLKSLTGNFARRTAEGKSLCIEDMLAYKLLDITKHKGQGNLTIVPFRGEFSLQKNSSRNLHFGAVYDGQLSPSEEGLTEKYPKMKDYFAKKDLDKLYDKCNKEEKRRVRSAIHDAKSVLKNFRKMRPESGNKEVSIVLYGGVTFSSKYFDEKEKQE